MVGRRSQHSEPSPTLGSLGFSYLWRHKPWVSLWGPLCAHVVAIIPHEEVWNFIGLKMHDIELANTLERHSMVA